MPARKSKYTEWYEHVKRDLLLSEPQNILARSECCQNIINECINHLNENLAVPKLRPSQYYMSNINPLNHLSFLLEWPGLRLDNSPKAPKSRKEYEKKSKNWLNGRRAPNYGKTLFPYFISEAEKYIEQISKILIGNNDIQKQKLYYDIVIYKVLAQLCGCSVSLHEQAKKAPFFCKNSVERKGKLKEILQSYASDHQYIQGFPSCFEEAIGYFDRKSNLYFHQFRSKYLGYNQPQQTIATKEENHSNSPRSQSSDVEYWKNQVIQLQQQIEMERKLRIKAETERDTLRSLINNQQTNGTDNHCHCDSQSHESHESPESQNPGLRNDLSFGSSTASTISVPTSMPQLSYGNSSNSLITTHQSVAIPNSYHSRVENNPPALPPMLGYVPNNTTMQINHSHLNQNFVPFVNNCNNNSNVFIHSDRNVSDMYSCDNTNIMSQFGAAAMSTATQQQNQQQNIQNPFLFNDNHNETTIVDMPMMTKQQLSDDSFGFNQLNDTQNGLNSPLPPMYSFQNAVVTNSSCI